MEWYLVLKALKTTKVSTKLTEYMFLNVLFSKFIDFLSRSFRFRLAYHVAGLLTKHCYKIIYSKVGVLFYRKSSKATFKIVKRRLSERYFLLFISCWFFENETTEICSHLSEKGPSADFLDSKITLVKEKETQKEKERVERKAEKRKKQWLYYQLLLILTTWEVVFGREKTVWWNTFIWQWRFQKSG